MRASSYTDPSGKTIVHLRDDRGEPSKIFSNAIDVSGMSEFNEIISFDLNADANANPPRPAFVRGQIFITEQDVPADPIAIEYVLAELRVVGYVGSSATVLRTAMLGGEQQSMRVTFEEDDTFDRIAIEARQIVDGEPSNVTAGSVDVLTVAAIAIMWS